MDFAELPYATGEDPLRNAAQERDDPSVQFQIRKSVGYDLFKFGPARIDCDQIHVFWKFRMHRIGAFHHNDTWIVAKFPVELSVSFFNCVHFLCTVLQETVDKSTRGASKVRADEPLHIDVKRLERMI